MPNPWFANQVYGLSGAQLRKTQLVSPQHQKIATDLLHVLSDHTKHVNLRKNAAGCLQVELNIQGCFMETTTYGQPRMAILWPYLQHST